jgi:hypothetical protein
LLKDQPEAVRLYTTLSGNWPGENKSSYIVERLGSRPDSAALKQALKLWTASGYRSANLPGLFDWYDELLRDPSWTPGDRFKARASPNGNGQYKRQLTRAEAAIEASERLEREWEISNGQSSEWNDYTGNAGDNPAGVTIIFDP